ncbi:MAG: chromate resistance protein [Candidatus Magnetominusculus sp. LBB02]|nr:chromate resistance protein [Candidatus Magnetominusculus sp. LBB02]
MLHSNKHRWLLFFYSIAAKPVSGRVKVWRRLVQAGAVQLKDAVYVLPYTDAHFEFFQWLSSEVVSLGGEAMFIKAEKIEMLDDAAIINLFNRHRKKDYAALERQLNDIESRIMPPLKDSNIKKLADSFHKCVKELGEIRKIDFFSDEGKRLSAKIDDLGGKLKGITSLSAQSQPAIEQKRREDYQGKTWVTRQRPFVDRMASSWLIKRFIDKAAAFILIAEGDILPSDAAAFDIVGGEFSHVGTLCTFEVMVKAFSIKDRAVKKIAEIVHEIDIRGDEYRNPESPGVEEILTGIQMTAETGTEALEKGAAIFELLYLSKTG